jgi:hypothetical protein
MNSKYLKIFERHHTAVFFSFPTQPGSDGKMEEGTRKGHWAKDQELLNTHNITKIRILK